MPTVPHQHALERDGTASHKTPTKNRDNFDAPVGAKEQYKTKDDLERGFTQEGTGEEKQVTEPSKPDPSADNGGGSAFNALGWLDRLLALWILLAMAIGIILGNFAPDIGPALQKGKFINVSIPIGMHNS